MLAVLRVLGYPCCNKDIHEVHVYVYTYICMLQGCPQDFMSGSKFAHLNLHSDFCPRPVSKLSKWPWTVAAHNSLLVRTGECSSSTSAEALHWNAWVAAQSFFERIFINPTSHSNSHVRHGSQYTCTYTCTIIIANSNVLHTKTEPSSSQVVHLLHKFSCGAKSFFPRPLHPQT